MGSMSLELKRALGIDAGQEASSIAGRVTGTPPRDALMSEHSDSDSSASDRSSVPLTQSSAWGIALWLHIVFGFSYYY